MPAEPTVPGSPIDWLKHAKSDLALAKINKPEDVLYEELCFHAQQAAEKSFKALLVASDTPVPKTHSIRLLLDLLSEKRNVPDVCQESAILTDYAVQARYPADYEEITEEEYKKTTELAETVFSWAEKIISESTGEDLNTQDTEENLP